MTQCVFNPTPNDTNLNLENLATAERSLNTRRNRERLEAYRERRRKRKQQRALRQQQTP